MSELEQLKVNFSCDPEFMELYKGIRREILEIEAIDLNSLDIVARKNGYMTNVEGVTGEENANVGKTIHPNHRKGKMIEPQEKFMAYHTLFVKMKEVFGLEKAREALYEVMTGCLAINDSSNIDLPYCVAYSSTHLMRDGRSYVTDVPNLPPTNFRSYMNMATESMFDACSEFLGATVIFDILIGMAYYTKYERENYHKAFEGVEDLNIVRRIASAMVASTNRSMEEAAVKIDKGILESNLYDQKDKTSIINYAVDYCVTNALQGWVHLAGNKFRTGYQSLFTNLNLFSPRVLVDNFEYYTYPDGSKVINHLDEILRIQTLFAEFFSQGIKGKNGLTKIVAMPVVTLCIPNDDEGAEEYAQADIDWYENILRLFHKYNNINVYRGLKLAMCCRLTVEKDTHADVNSLGVTTKGGSNNAVGSLRVVTAGLTTVAQELLSSEEFIEASTDHRIDLYLNTLEYKLDIATNILRAQRELIYENEKKGFFHLASAGWVDFTKLASTYGALGLFEAVKLISGGSFDDSYTEEELVIGNEILLLFDRKCKENREKYNFPFSQEVSIPGESMAFRFADRERIMFGSFAIEYSELSNQFSPLTKDIPLSEKLYNEQVLSSLVAPSGICHINSYGALSPEANVNLHRAIWKTYPNIEHYAINNEILNCIHGHAEVETTLSGHCILCGEKIHDITTRSIGYFKSVPFAFGKRRAEEEKRRIFYKQDDDFIIYYPE